MQVYFLSNFYPTFHNLGQSWAAYQVAKCSIKKQKTIIIYKQKGQGKTRYVR